MQVPGGTKEYTKHIGECRTLLGRLTKGRDIYKAALEQRDYAKVGEVLWLWLDLSNKMLRELELATLSHQFILTGNSVLIQANGKPIKSEEIVKEGTFGLDPYLLLSMRMLKEVFGDDLHDFIEIKQ